MTYKRSSLMKNKNTFRVLLHSNLANHKRQNSFNYMSWQSTGGCDTIQRKQFLSRQALFYCFKKIVIQKIEHCRVKQHFQLRKHV